MKKYLPSIISLVSICALVAILMATTNLITHPFIKRNEVEATRKALAKVLPEATEFQALESLDNLPDSIIEAYVAPGVGYVFKMKVSGFSSGLVVLCGIKEDGSVSSAICLASSETNGAEKTYGKTLEGKTLADIDAADTVSGSTKTTEAYKNAVKDALTAFNAVSGKQ